MPRMGQRQAAAIALRAACSGITNTRIQQPQQRLLQSDPAITDLGNKISVIAKRLKFKFIRYTEVGLAGGSLEKRPVQQAFRYNGVRYS